MSEKILVIPNTMQQAYVGIDELFEANVFSAPAARLLKALYAHGWDDGVVCLDANDLATSSGLSSSSIDLAMYELLSSGLVRLRTDAQSDVLELVVLANLEANMWSKLAWWHYCFLQDDEAA